MKLAVLQNPPYQISDGGGGTGSSAKPLYHKFITTIIDELSPNYLVSLNPSRWMAGGKGLDKFRHRMINDKHIKKIVHFPGEREVFPTVQIPGGIHYFLWEKEHDGKCEFVVGDSSATRDLDEFDIVVQDNNALSILHKIIKKTSVYVSCFSRNPFGLATNFDDWKSSGTKCWLRHFHINFCDPEAYTDKHGIVDKWKVAIGKAYGDGGAESSPLRVTCLPFLIEPSAICTDTYLIVNAFDTKSEAVNFRGYMKTKFFRFMLRLRLVTQNISKEKFSWVPDLDYSCPWTDAELYHMFGLSRQERSYIEFKIKELR